MAKSSSEASQMKYVIFLLLLVSALMGVASEQMPDNLLKTEYDVFVNFRGEDIRHGFLGFLSEAFRQKQIDAFVDDKLEKGDEIWPSLVGAIQGSSISLTIFSENYASSRWCLEELVRILECREKHNQTVIPVFYQVYPTTVRHQTGSYNNSLAELGKEHNLTSVQNWKHALKKAADLSGLVSFDYKKEVELVGEIINTVNLALMKLEKYPFNFKKFIGIDKPIQYLESLLHQESKNVSIIGIWGMGGIGKTSIAEEMFSKLYSKYDGYYFLANVKEESKRHETISLKKNLFSALLGENVKINMPGFSNYIKRRMGRMKVLIVLDDVNDSDLLIKLFGNPNWFGSGSGIIITTRDKQVLVANKVDDIYEVEALNSSEALELFSMHAFKQNHFDMEYYELSKRVVNYAKGIPLVLKVLGHLLCGKDKAVWESQLEKLKNMPNRDVYNAMRLSYDDLDHKEQKILLDLGCFFIGLNLKVDRLKVLLKDGERDDSVVVGLERLKDRALIIISKDNVVFMHDIIQEMAWEIVRHESFEDPGRHSRLWNHYDIYEVLKYNKGTEAIRSIRVDLAVIWQLNLSPQIFTKMSRLQFLHVFPCEGHQTFLPHGLQFPVDLKYLSWTRYPLKSLPVNFSAKNLVILDLRFGRAEKLWDGVQDLKNLKEIKVSKSALKALPDLSKATNLEVLDMHSCSQITKIIIRSHLSSLNYLSLRECRKLREFSVTSENMIELDLSFTRVNALPSSFGRQSKLEVLFLTNSGIERLPSSFKNLTRLQYLNVVRSIELHTLTELPPSLQTLYATGCISLKTVLFPSIAEQFKENRRYVLFWNCLKLDEHSLKAIGLNAHINMMRFAYRYLSAPDEYYNDYNRSHASYQVRYVYPGSRVPEWLEYQTASEFIIIDLSSTPHSSLLGFIFGFAISGRKILIGNRFTFYITVSDEDESKKDSIDIYMSDSLVWVASDHVCLIYDLRCSRYLKSRAKNQTRLKIKVEAMAGAVARQRAVGIKGFGVSPINTSSYHNFIQQVNTSADHRFVQQMEVSYSTYFFFMLPIFTYFFFMLPIFLL